MANNEIEQGTVRIKKWLGGQTIHITDCAAAGKRGKVCRELSVSVIPVHSQNQVCNIMYNLPIKLEDVYDYATAISWSDAVKDSLKEDVRIYEGELKSVRVPPLGFKPIEVENEYFWFSCDWETFTAADKTDQANCPRWISTESTPRASFKKIRGWVIANRSEVVAMRSMHEFTAALKDATNARGHYYCAMD